MRRIASSIILVLTLNLCGCAEVAYDTTKTAGKVAIGTTKLAGKAVVGTAKLITYPFRTASKPDDDEEENT